MFKNFYKRLIPHLFAGLAVALVASAVQADHPQAGLLRFYDGALLQTSFIGITRYENESQYPSKYRTVSLSGQIHICQYQDDSFKSGMISVYGGSTTFPVDASHHTSAPDPALSGAMVRQYFSITDCQAQDSTYDEYTTLSVGPTMDHPHGTYRSGQSDLTRWVEGTGSFSDGESGGRATAELSTPDRLSDAIQRAEWTPTQVVDGAYWSFITERSAASLRPAYFNVAVFRFAADFDLDPGIYEFDVYYKVWRYEEEEPTGAEQKWSSESGHPLALEVTADDQPFVFEGRIHLKALDGEVMDPLAGGPPHVSIPLEEGERVRIVRVEAALPGLHPDPPPPADIFLSGNIVEEHRPIGTLVGDITATHPDGHPPEVSALVEGEGDESNALFTIEDNTLKTAAVLTYETASSHTIRVRAKLLRGDYVEKVFIIEVEQNQPPTDLLLSDNAVREKEPAATIVGMFSAIDPDDEEAHTLSFVNGQGDAGNPLFTIAGNTLKTAEVLDLEEESAHTIRVRITDRGGLVFEKNFTITVDQDLYRAWSMILPAGERGEMDDSGGHGIPNLLRYAFAMDPLNPEEEKLPQAAQQSGRLTLTYIECIDDSKILYIVEASDDLVTWTELFLPTRVITDHGNGVTQTVVVTDSQTTDSRSRRFLRLWVER